MKEEDPEIHAAEGELYKRSEKVFVLFSSLGGRFLRGGITLKHYSCASEKAKDAITSGMQSRLCHEAPSEHPSILCKVAPPVNC